MGCSPSCQDYRQPTEPDRRVPYVGGGALHTYGAARVVAQPVDHTHGLARAWLGLGFGFGFGLGLGLGSADQTHGLACAFLGSGAGLGVI